MTDIGKIKVLTEASTALKEQNISELFSYFIRLYVSERISQTDIDADGDMLLYQWEINNRYVELDLTRQIMLDLADPDDAADSMVQLSVRCRFKPAQILPPDAGNEWCSNPSEVDNFTAMITGSQSFKSAMQSALVKISIILDRL